KSSSYSSHLNSWKRILSLMPWILLGTAASPAVAQQATVSLGSGSAVPGGTVILGVSLTTSGGAQPAALQWTMTYSASDVTGVNVTAGISAIAASKSVSCSSKAGSPICVVSV